MNKLYYKIATAISTASLLAGSIVPGVYGSTTITITGNGSDSYNKADVEVDQTTYVSQINEANVQNTVYADASTGGNRANDNTGGDVSIETGDATSNVTIENSLNTNVAEVNPCCPGDTTLKITGNGSDSYNKIDVDINQEEETGTLIEQGNLANVNNWVDAYAGTGKNKANDNTGGDVSIETGDADIDVEISNALNANSATIGGSGSNDIDIEISGNGSDSKNKVYFDLDILTWLTQGNEANVQNTVYADAKTGKNKANDNTGGDVSIETGDADVNVDVSNLANFNSADLDACECVTDVDIKISGNGTDSKNKVDLDLEKILGVLQGNEFNCKNGVDACAEVYADAQTGKNKANDNTGDVDDPGIQTGDASVDVTVDNTANANVLGNADLPDFDFPDLEGLNVNGLILLLLAIFS